MVVVVVAAENIPEVYYVNWCRVNSPQTDKNPDSLRLLKSDCRENRYYSFGAGEVKKKDPG